MAEQEALRERVLARLPALVSVGLVAQRAPVLAENAHPFEHYVQEPRVGIKP